MSSKTRKLIWSVPLMATIAVVGALAVFVALGLPNADPAEAQDNLPGMPASMALEAGNGEITVVIQPPTDPGIPEFTGYSLQYNAQTGTTVPGVDDDGWTDAGEVDVRRDGVGAAVVDGLMNSTQYFFRAAATRGSDMGPYLSTDVDAQGRETPDPVAPDAPTITIAQRTTTSIDVSWTVANDGGEDITLYGVAIDMGGSCAALASNTATSTTCMVEVGTTYEVTVMATNSAGTTDGTESITISSQVDVSSLDFDTVISSDSSSSGGSPEIQVVFPRLEADLPVGSSVVLYLEDDYQEPASIPTSSVYFVADMERSVATGNGARVYASVAPEIDTDAYFDATKSDISIRVFIPDMCSDTGASGDTNPCAGPNGPAADQRLTMVIADTSGIKNPSEAGKHSAAVRVLGPADAVPGPTIARANASAAEKTDGNIQGGTGSQAAKFVLLTAAKVKLSDNNNKRGYELTVTGTGYNNDTTATAYVLAEPTVAQWWNSLDCAEMVEVVGDRRAASEDTNPYCKMYAGLGATELARVHVVFEELPAGFKFGSNGCTVVVDNGVAIGTATVGGDDNAAIPVTITVPTFKPGKVNYICVSDGESRGSGADVEVFELEDSIRVIPGEVNAGDTVTLFAEDFISTPGNVGFHSLKLGGVTVYPSEDAEYEGLRLQLSGIGSDGSATITFEMPPTIGGNPVKGIIRVDGRWGDATTGPTADTTITVKPAGLTLTKEEALPNQSITIQGSGFSNTSQVQPEKITIDGVALMVDADSLRDDVVRISNGGQFVATIYLWPENRLDANPALVTGIHTIRVEDDAGFVGTTSLTILEPTITVVPLVAGPRDYVVIRGENFPVDNLEGGAVGPVAITVNDSRERNYSEIPDGSGRFVVEHQVSSNVAIPSVATIKATYGSEITKTGSFQVPEAIITVEPALVSPGDSITLSVDGMPVYASVDSITVGGREALGNLNVNTDRDGSVTVEGVVVPGLDPGIYSVQLEVNDIVAIGQVEVVAEGPRGLALPLPAALDELGDNLVRVFSFNGVDKTWSFFDPRADFADVNTLTEMISGQPYWILVSETVDDVVLNNKSRTLTCVGGDCWNQLVW